MAGPNAGRRGGRWRKLRENLRLQRNPCWLCGQGIDYSLKWPDSRSFSVDHAVPLGKDPTRAEDPGNLRASHLGCNASRQDNDPRPTLGSTSRNW